MINLNLLSIAVTVLLMLSTASAAENTKNADQSNVREPASSIETKKDIANQGFPQSEEPPTRLLDTAWRKSMAESGFEWDAFYFWNGVSNQSGGAAKGAVGFSTIDILMHFDFEKMMGWTGGSFHAQHHTHGGEAPGNYVGDAMGVNSYAPPYENDSFLSQAYFKQTWGEGSWDALAGLYDFSSEFFVTDSSLIFLNNGFLLGAELYPPAPAELSIYPVNALATRIKWVMEKSGYLMAGISSGVARDPNYTNGTHPRLGKDEGFYQIVEAGWQKECGTDVFNKVAVGMWNFTNDYPKTDGSGRANYNGLYALVDYHVTGNIAAFFRYGMANKDIASISSSVAAGINYTGLLGESDQIGFGVAQSSLSAATTDALKAGGDDPASSEQAIEVVYRNEIMPGIVLTPDLQMVKTPSMSKTVKDATVASLRLELSF